MEKYPYLTFGLTIREIRDTICVTIEISYFFNGEKM